MQYEKEKKMMKIEERKKSNSDDVHSFESYE